MGFTIPTNHFGIVKIIQFKCPIEEEILVAADIIVSERGLGVAPIEIVQRGDAGCNLVANLESIEKGELLVLLSVIVAAAL